MINVVIPEANEESWIIDMIRWAEMFYNVSRLFE